MSGKPQSWNDWLALIILIGIPAIWVWGHLQDIILGATIAGWTLVIQYYFRKAPDTEVPT